MQEMRTVIPLSTLPAQVALANLDFIQNKALMKEKLEAAFSKPKAGEDVASINRVYLGRLDVHVRSAQPLGSFVGWPSY